MNRCITCHKQVSRIKAQVAITYNDHQYYVCCPLCQAEFEKNPEKYIEIAKVALGDYAVLAHTQTTVQDPADNSDEKFTSSSIIENLFKDSERIFEQFSRFEKDFNQFINQSNKDANDTSSELTQQITELKSRLLFHTGACHFNAAVIRSESQDFKLEKKNISGTTVNENEKCH